METNAHHRASMDDLFHLPNFPHMVWVDPSALPTIVMMPSLRARLECILLHRLFNDTLVSQLVPHPHTISQGRCLTYANGLGCLMTKHHQLFFLQNEALLLDVPFGKCNSGKYLVSLTDRQHEGQIQKCFLLITFQIQKRGRTRDLKM